MNDTFMKTKPVFPLLVSMALPNVISMLVNSLYNIVDSLFVAQINEQAMTALSLVFPIQNFVNAVAIGFGVGINALVALYRGAGDHDRADAAATHGMALSVLHGILCTLAATAIMPGFLARFTADGTIVSMGVTYSTIVFLFATVNMASLAFEKLFQAVGRMKLTMIAHIGGTVDAYRTRRHLRDGHYVRELLQGEPVMVGHHLILDEGQHGVTASETEHSDF